MEEIARVPNTEWGECKVDDYEGIGPPRQLVPASGYEDDPVTTTSVSLVQRASPAATIPPLPRNAAEGIGANQDRLPGHDPPVGEDPAVDQNPPCLGKSRPAVFVKGQTIEQGAPPVTIGGKPVEFSQGSFYVDGVAAAAPNPEKQGNGGKAAKAKPAIVVQGQTIRQGEPPVTINGNKSPIQVGKTAVPIVPANKDQPAAPVEVQGMTFTPVVIPRKGAKGGSANNRKDEARPVVLFKGQTLTETGVLSPSAQAGHVLRQSHLRPIYVAGLSFTPQPIRTQGPDTIPAVMVAGRTLTEGAPAVSVNGAKLAYSVYVNRRAASLPTPGLQAEQSAKPPIVAGGLQVASGKDRNGDAPVRRPTIAGHIIIQRPASTIAINGTVNKPGNSPLTISGTPISLNAIALVIGSSSIPLTPGPSPIATITGQPISQDRNGAVVMAGKTFLPSSPAITVSGRRSSLAATVLIAGTSTIPLPGRTVLYALDGEAFTRAPTVA
ncbi:MAG: hypothetical protein Q9173_004857 [Seirophora scorigena]